jgi:NitT/TauT family transport system permease protein
MMASPDLRAAPPCEDFRTNSSVKINFHWKIFLKTLLPAAVLALLFLIHKSVPTNSRYIIVESPSFTEFLSLLFIFFLLCAAASLFSAKLQEKLAYKALFLSVAFLLLGVYDLATIKLNLLPSLYFPAPGRIVDVFVSEGFFILQCLAYSLRLLLGGFFLGALAGVLTGTLIGWSPRWNYWIMPLIRVIGPIPSTAWIPVALVVFTKAAEASLFLIALGVWFPTAVLTSSGIMNVPKNYFEVSSTLGAGNFRNIVSVALPAAAPSIFTGLFNGTSASFLTLMAAEMIGCKFGIGWYINWQRETLAYPQIYAALIVIAAVFSILISLQFKIRNRVLSWQKGVIRW